MNRFFFPLLLTVTLALCACSIRSGHTNYQLVPLKKAEPLSVGKGIYVAMPEDFQKDGSIEKGSGAQAQKALQTAMAAVPGNKTFAGALQENSHAMETAQTAGHSLLVAMRIMDWSDPPASFQYASDRGEVMLLVYDAETGALLRSDSVTCNGSATTVNLIGAYSPADCLEPAFAKWSGQAFGN